MSDKAEWEEKLLSSLLCVVYLLGFVLAGGQMNHNKKMKMLNWIKEKFCHKIIIVFSLFPILFFSLSLSTTKYLMSKYHNNDSLTFYYCFCLFEVENVRWIIFKILSIYVRITTIHSHTSVLSWKLFSYIWLKERN